MYELISIYSNNFTIKVGFGRVLSLLNNNPRRFVHPSKKLDKYLESARATQSSGDCEEKKFLFLKFLKISLYTAVALYFLGDIWLQTPFFVSMMKRFRTKTFPAPPL